MASYVDGLQLVLKRLEASYLRQRGVLEATAEQIASTKQAIEAATGQPGLPMSQEKGAKPR